MFDFGGGTLDITILTIANRQISVKCCVGDSSLGGVDIDRFMMQHVLADILKEKEIDLGNDDKSKAKIAKYCKIAKHMFNEDAETATVEIEYLTADIEDYELDIAME